MPSLLGRLQQENESDRMQTTSFGPRRVLNTLFEETEVSSEGGPGSPTSLGSGLGSPRYERDKRPDDVIRMISPMSTRSTVNRSRYDRTPVRFAFGGEWALQQCEELTTWVNEILKRRNLPAIVDLRRSLQDGITLANLVETLNNDSVEDIQREPWTRVEKIRNLQLCVNWLSESGVDVTNIDCQDLANGDLKSSIALISIIKNKFNNQKHQEVGNGNTTVANKFEVVSVNSHINMPGKVTLPVGALGAMPAIKDGLVESSRHTTFNSDLLPGTLDKVVAGATSPSSKALVSTTELGMNGVSQHGVEERRQHMLANNTNSRAYHLRPHTAKSADSLQENGPPKTVTNAWTTGQNKIQVADSDMTVEERLKTLLNNAGAQVGSHRLSQPYEDGELLVPPPPVSRSHDRADFERTLSTLGQKYSGSNPAVIHQRGRSDGEQWMGYVPSKPSDRMNGARGEVLINRPLQTPPMRPSYPQRSPDGQYDNDAYVPDQAPIKGRRFMSAKESARSSGNDLRDAWNKLFGQQSRSTVTTPVPQSFQQNTGTPAIQSSAFTTSPVSTPTLTRQHSGQNVNEMGAYSARVPTPGYATPTSTQDYSQLGISSARMPTPSHMNRDAIHSGRLPGQMPKPNETRHGAMRLSSDHHKLDASQNNNTALVLPRPSPMGQSSSTQGFPSGSNSSPLSALSGQSSGGIQELNSQEKILFNEHLALGPSSLYPETVERSLGQSRPNVGPKPRNYQRTDDFKVREKQRQLISTVSEHVNSVNTSSKIDNEKGSVNKVRSNRTELSSGKHKKKKRVPYLSNIRSTHRNTAKSTAITRNPRYVNSFDDSDILPLDINVQDSIFDYGASGSESSRSFTPPLPPLSPSDTLQESELSSSIVPLEAKFTRSVSTSMLATSRSPDLLSLTRPSSREITRDRRASGSQFDFQSDKRKIRHSNRISVKSHQVPTDILSDVRESGDDSNLSFDVDDTILMVESQDDQQIPRNGIGSTEATAIRKQIEVLENMYQDLLSIIGVDKDVFSSKRRWSICSSDTSTLRQARRFKPSVRHKHHHNKEIKAVHRRVQRLESHVVTLARSVAHLSSELRAHNAMVNDLETLKIDVREMKEQGVATPFGRSDFNSFRAWLPSLTNPVRVNKLTKFFGQEPPLLQIFLKKLGYEKYAPNFEAEHIGIVELPYMTEERLEKIGIPMGPRLRILQEAQLSFRHENFNIYIV